MYQKNQKYHNSCYPCALQIALVNIGNLPENYGDKLEDDFNERFYDLTGRNLDEMAPNENQIASIISSLGLPLGRGAMLGPEILRGNERRCADRINQLIEQNPNAAFVIGENHAFSIYRCEEEGKWYLVDPRYLYPIREFTCEEVRVRPNEETHMLELYYIDDRGHEVPIFGGWFFIMVTPDN